MQLSAALPMARTLPSVSTCGMNTHATHETSADPEHHAENIRKQLSDLISHLREDVAHVDEPRFQALLETGAEVLGGLKTAFEHYSAKTEKAWRR
jgi:hypothetical protein